MNPPSRTLSEDTPPTDIEGPTRTMSEEEFPNYGTHEVIAQDDADIVSYRDLEAATKSGGKRSSTFSSIKATLESEKYDAEIIRAEFKTYQNFLPEPDKLLQEQHSFQTLRSMIEENNTTLPRFLKHKHEKGIAPHHALCCLMLSEYETETRKETSKTSVYACFIRALSFGNWYPQINNPAEFIRDQFYRVAHAVPADVVQPSMLRKKIRDRGLPVPNYFLDPESDKQFPPHIALLVILQDGESESKHLDNTLYRVEFSIVAFVAMLLRFVLEVIGGAGAIWGGAEVFFLRNYGGNGENNEIWRWISVGVGILAFARLVTLTAPQKEDEGDMLGPAGPWSLRFPLRMRAITEQPFHYFVRAVPPFSYEKKHD